MFSEILQHIKNPVNILMKFSKLLTENGTIIGSVPNFKKILIKKKLIKNNIHEKKQENFDETFLNFTKKRILLRWFKESNLDVVCILHHFGNRFRWFSIVVFPFLKDFFASKIIFSVRKTN